MSAPNIDGMPTVAVATDYRQLNNFWLIVSSGMRSDSTTVDLDAATCRTGNLVFKRVICPAPAWAESGHAQDTHVDRRHAGK